MRNLVTALWIGFLAICTHSASEAGENILDNFENQPDQRWEFFADTVMGGVSTGQVSFGTENNIAYAQMTGQVSTENNGGFIQFRTKISDRLSDETKGVRLLVRGNSQRYFVHLRTGGTILPWQYYQGGFDTSESWSEVRIPLSEFKASGRILRSEVRPRSIKSIAIVAFGSDHQADVKVREIGFYE